MISWSLKVLVFFDDFYSFNKTVNKSDINESVLKFFSIKNSSYGLADFLTSTIIINMHYSLKNRKMANYIKSEDEYSNLSENDVKIFTNLYEKNWNSGYQKEKEELNNYFKCNPLNLMCKLYPLKEKLLDTSLNGIMTKNKISFYNIQHINEYLDWSEQIMKNPSSIFSNPSPGNRFYNIH